MSLLLQCLSLVSTARTVKPQPLAIEDLYQQYYTPLTRYLEGLCGSHEQAEELVQETFIKAYLGLYTFRGECSVSTWLFRIARNVYLNSARAARHTMADHDVLHLLADASQHSDPVLQAAASEQRSQIDLVLAQLPERQRSVLLLRDAEGLSYSEIAGVLGISLAAVKLSLFRARNSFRSLFNQMEGIEDE